MIDRVDKLIESMKYKNSVNQYCKDYSLLVELRNLQKNLLKAWNFFE